MSRTTRRIAGAAVVGACAVALAAPALASPTQTSADRSSNGYGHSPRNVDVQILSFNDFHGNLEPPSGSSG